MTTPVAGSTSQPGNRDEHPAAANEASGAFVTYDKFIDDQLRTARRQVRTIDIAVSLMTLGAGTLGFFLFAVLCDHWAFSGGLGTVGRWLALLAYLAGGLTYCWYSLLPLCIRRINPVYAAHAIERSKPTLKNSLINFLLLRARPTELAPHVYEAIEQRAAIELAQVPVEATIDRSKLITIGYVFLGLMLAAAVYKVSSPKDPFLTVGRIVLPWADLAPPTRVTITDVRPGNSTVMRGQRVKISAEVHGVSRPQTVQLIFSTDDGQIVERSIPMQLPVEGYLFECELPEGKGGIQQDVKYRVVAGDANSNEFRLTVQAAPTIVIENVEYVYPDYTGMISQTVEHQGDLKAIEGTQVTLHALANQPIKSAAIDFDSNGSDDQRMTFDDRHASATVELGLKADRQTSEHTNYQLRFTNVDGKENPQPIRHQIEVTRDVPPEIEFLAPNRDEIDLPLNRRLVCEVSAHDPDFALARVAIVGQSTAGQPFERSLLDEPSKTGKPWQGQFRKKLVLVPKKLGLKVGDVLEYWAWAEDNKTPVANRTETSHRRVRIVSPSKSDESADAMASRDQASEDQSPSADGKRSDNPSESPDDENAPDDQTEPPKGASDPKRKQNPRPDGVRPPGADPKANQERDQSDSMQDPPAGDQDRGSSDQQPGSNNQGEGDPSEKKQSEKEQDGQEKSGEDQPGKGQSGKGQSGQGKSGKDSARQEGSGTGESGDSSAADDSQTGGGEEGKNQSGKSGNRGKQGDNRPRGKSQPVAQDGSQDGQAFEEIIEQQDEQDSGDSGAGTRRMTTRRSSAPPSNGKPAEQATGQESSDADKGDQPVGDPQRGEKKSGSKEGGDKKTADTKNSDKKENDKQPTESGGADADGESADGKSANGDDKKSQRSEKEEKDPAGGSEGKMPAGDGQTGSSDGGEKEKAAAEGEPTPNGKPTGKKSKPDGKQINQTGQGEEKDASEADGQAGAEAGGQTKSGQSGQGKDSQGKQPSGKQSSGKQAADQQPSDDPSPEDGASDQSATGTKPDKKRTPKNPVGGGTEEQGGDQTGETKSGSGGQPPGKSGQKSTQKPNGKGPPDGKSGDGQEDQGEAGAGQNAADDKEGSGKPQGANRPGKKSSHGNKPDGERDKSGDPSAPSSSDHQSDSEGDQSGDRSGGGKKGPGQKSQQAGQGEPGSQSEAEDGGDTATDPGGQESAEGPGGDRKADKPTRQSGKSAGKGSTPSGKQSKSATQEKRSGKPDSQADPGNDPSGKGGKAGPGQGTGNSGESEPIEPPPTLEQADAANIEFARKATELTIQRLRDQLEKGEVDQDLLDRLQWSQQDMERWVGRWEEMFRRSTQKGKEGETARIELDGALRSLGLRPHAAQISGHRPDDNLRGVKETRRTRPPAEYRDQVRQYMQGISRTQNGAQPPRPVAPPGTEKAAP